MTAIISARDFGDTNSNTTHKTEELTITGAIVYDA